MAEKTAVHIGFAIFCMAAMHGDTSKKKKKKSGFGLEQNCELYQCVKKAKKLALSKSFFHILHGE